MWLLDSMMLSGIYDFFFQAEDGIRDRLVTGVQTCALPILRVNVISRGIVPSCLSVFAN